MNKIILMGRLTRDPDIRYTVENRIVGSFSLAVNRRFAKQGEDTADFFSCTTFGKTAEFVEKYLRKGSKILLSGRIQNNNYTDRDGRRVFSVQIIVEELEFAESKKTANQHSNQPTHAGDDGFMHIPDADDDEIPFN